MLQKRFLLYRLYDACRAQRGDDRIVALFAGEIGLADFRVRSFEAVDKFIVVVHLAWAYVEQRFARERSAQVTTYGDIIRRHRDEHAIDWLTGAVEMAIETGKSDLVLQRFLRLEPQPT